MAFTGSLLSGLNRVSIAPPLRLTVAAPLSLLAEGPSARVFAAHAAILEALASTLSFGTRESAAVAESVAVAAALASDLATTQHVSVVIPASVGVAQSVFLRASQSAGGMKLPLRASQTLAIDTWRALIATLKTAVANARTLLPAAASVALIATAAAIALHVATVRLPDWRKYLEREFGGITRPPRVDAARAPLPINKTDPSQMDISDLAREVIALR
ncbi:hypothetical protein BC830DRAFT_1170147 [Chytriomyces sp. MP71]|nr:hypothetical protein BC830DRAFT_1170147 [Chytriomyces sp. MP71]